MVASQAAFATRNQAIATWQPSDISCELKANFAIASESHLYGFLRTRFRICVRPMSA